MQHLETCLLIAEADRILCHLILSCFSRIFALDLKNEIHLISRLFNLSFIAGVFSGFLVEKCAI